MPRKLVSSAVLTDPDKFIFGHAPAPVTTKSGLVIGGGSVYPEVNFTLPPMMITEETFPEAKKNYEDIVEGVCKRAEELSVPGYVIELEILPPMTAQPEWGIEICRTVNEILEKYRAKNGIPTAIRMTAVDIREGRDLEYLWKGSHWDRVMQTLEGSAAVGGELMAIESVGGKEVHDEATMFCDLPKSIFALSVLGAMDMERLWTSISDIADRTGTVPAGDAACGFANTAMVLADRGFIPHVFAATVRVVSAVRSLVAVECGARGPLKDCGYEGVFIKAMTGVPTASEGRSAAGAHLSPIGNIAGCTPDLWSNESIQNIRLLSDQAPTVALEQLAYDCRLFNTATERGDEAALLLRDLHADSDSHLDPQAYVLRPEIAVDIAGKIVQESDDYERGKLAARLALEAIRNGHDSGELALNDREEPYLDILDAALEDMPDTVDEMLAEVADTSEAFDPKKYEL